MTNTEPTSTTDEPTIRILKIANCPSLSGRSTLTYHIGCKVDDPRGKEKARRAVITYADFFE